MINKRHLIIIFVLLCFLFTAKDVFAQEYVLPYPGFMPGHPLYKISNAVDKIQEWWSFGNFAKFTYHMNMADKKLVETKTLFEYKQYLLASQALEQHEKHLKKTSFFLDQAKTEGKNISQKKEIFKSAITKYKIILELLRQELPEIFYWKPEKDKPQIIGIKALIEDSIKLGRELVDR